MLKNESVSAAQENGAVETVAVITWLDLQRGDSVSPPVHGDGGHRVDAGEHGRDGEKVVEFAVSVPEVPLSVSGVDEVDQSVERGHGRVRKGQVEDKVVGHCPHALVSQNDPNDDQVPEDRHRQNEAVGDGPEGDAPRRLHKLVGVVPRDVGAVV